MDLTAALRRPMRTPFLTLLVIVLTAALVVVNATAFGAIHTLRWKTLPYADGDALVDLRAHLKNFGMVVGLNAALRESVIADRTHFNGALGFTETNENEEGRPWHLTRVTPDFATFFGVMPALGRPFTEAESKPGADRAMILSETTWRSRYGADPAIVGRTIRFGDRPFEVIGVMPRGFSFPDATTDAWFPYVETAAEREQAAEGSVGALDVIARRADGVSVGEARAALGAILERDPTLAGTREGTGLEAAVTPWRERLAGEHEKALVLFQIAAVILLAVVISNLVNLELDRLIARKRELEVRRALGATHRHLRGGFLVERAPAVAAGLALGLFATPVALRLALASDLLPPDLPQGVAFGWPSFAIALTVALSALLVPALAPSSSHVGPLNRAGIGGVGRLRSALLVAQITLTTALVGTTSLLLQSSLNIASIDPGFDADGVVLANVDPAGVTLAERRFDPHEAKYRPVVQKIRDDVAALPGVDRATVASAPPFTGSEMVSTIRASGRPEDLQARQRQVGHGYFETLGITLVAGRDFEGNDVEDANEVIVDEVYRDRYLNGLDPLTQYVEFPKEDGSFHRARIVGVARTVRQHALDESAPLATVYTLHTAPRPTFWLVAHAAGNARDLVDVIRRRVLQSDPQATIVASTTLSDRIARTLRNRESLQDSIGVFAAATLALSMIGLAAVLGFAIRRRTAEIGVRIALGATPARIRNLVLRQGAGLIALGVGLGLATGLAFARLLADRMYGVTFLDGGSWAATLAIVAAVALFACWWPARRAAATDPIEALQHD
jgi:putative ABC transport system permease protein